nr:hypothetical protein [Tanacetum cinerariifolium]
MAANTFSCCSAKIRLNFRMAFQSLISPMAMTFQPLFCGMKWIKREFSVARTPQQNGVAQRKNRTIIAGTMLADSLLLIPFWAEAVNTACYVQNRVLVTKPHNKTPYELLLGRTPSTEFMRPFGCPVTILNTLDPLEKFDGKADERFFVGYSVNSKAFKVFNSRTKIVQETLHITFLENQPNVTGNGPTWLFDIDTLTQSMNYQPVVAGKQPNHNAGIQENFDAGKVVKEAVSAQQYVLLPLWSAGSQNPHNTDADVTFDVKENDPSDNVVSPTFKIGGKSLFVDPSQYPDDPDMPALEDIVYSDDEKDVGAEADFSNLETSMTVNPIPTTRVHKDHYVTQIIGDLTSTPQTRSMARMEEPKRVHQALKDPSWIESMQEKLLQFKMQKGHTKKEGIEYEEVFAPVARIEAMRLFLAYASFMGFMVYQMDVKSAFLYRTIKEEVYVCQPPGVEDPDYPDKVYKVVKALYGLHQAHRASYEILANYLLENGFQRGKIDQTLFIKKQTCDILLVQVYVDDIIFGSTNKELCKAFEKLMKDKFQMSSVDGKSASTSIDTEKPLLKDPDGEDLDVHIYRYLKSKPYLGLWYPKDHLFNLVAYSDSDYAGASIDRKSTTGGCQFLGCRLISWQCKKQTLVAISSTEALVLVKKSIDVVKLQALIVRKKVVITEDTIRQDLRLDDADGVECLPNEEIFDELTRMGYENQPPKLTFYKVFFSAQWKFLIHTIVQCMSAKRTAWNEFSSSMASAVICLATESFANIRRIGKGFSGVETHLFDTMLVQPQVHDAAEIKEDEDDNEVHAAPSSPSPTHEPSPPPQEHIPSPPQASPVPLSSPPQAQPTQPADTSESSMTLLNKLMRVGKLERRRGSKHSGSKRLRKVELDDDEDVTLVYVDTAVEMNADTQGRMEEDVNAVKKVNAAEPTVFDDVEVTMTMAQTLIKMKAEKARLLDEQMAKRLQDKEIEQAAARERQEKENL